MQVSASPSAHTRVHTRARTHTHTHTHLLFPSEPKVMYTVICLKVLHPEAATAEPRQTLSHFFP